MCLDPSVPCQATHLPVVLSMTEKEMRLKVLDIDACFRRSEFGLLEIVPDMPPKCDLSVGFVFPLHDPMRKHEACGGIGMQHEA